MRSVVCSGGEGCGMSCALEERDALCRVLWEKRMQYVVCSALIFDQEGDGEQMEDGASKPDSWTTQIL